MILMKLDMRKAYDTIDWNFIRDLLTAMNFPPHFVALIMQCITTPTYTISVNGTNFGFFKGQRGLGQGDPVSALIFTLVMEYFSRLLHRTSNTNSFKYHPLCRKFHLNYLLFADDLLLFSKRDLNSVAVLLETFKIFSKASGLHINESRSNIYFNGLCDREEQKILKTTRLTKGSIPFKYLGIHISNKRISKLD